MRRALPLVFLFALPLAAADNVYESPSGHQCLVEILRKSAWGLGGPSERAAFITEQLDGALRCEEWPAMHTYHAEHYHGAVPPQAIAIAHTHPVNFPFPSVQDEEEATRLGIPIYTITIRGVYKSMPGVRYAVMITNRQAWIRETPSLAALQASGSTAAKSDTASNR